jgi:hypothetical protein
VWLSTAVEQNLREWSGKCEKCGFDLVLEPVSALIARQFPGTPPGVAFEALTTRCAMCAGTQMLQRRTAPLQPAAKRRPITSWPVVIAVGAAIAIALLQHWLLR